MRKVVFLLIIVSFIISAMMLSCAQKSQLPVMQDAITKTETKPTETKPTEPSTPKPTDIQRDKTPKETITERELQPAKREEVKTTIKELQGRFKDVYFDFDKYDIKDEAKPIIKQVADAMIANKRISLVIEGHCDERGTREYNLSLGEKRANAVKQYLISLGVSSNRIDTVSYGKERPQCHEKTEECWAKNRRAHFVFLEAGQ